MKITFPVLTLSIGGAQRMLAELANGLFSRGHDVTILMPPTGEIDYPLKAKVVRSKKDYFLYEEDYPNSDVIVSNFHLVVPSADAASKNGKGAHIRLSLCYEPTFLQDSHVTFPTYHLTDKLMVLSKWQRDMIYLNHGIKGHIVPVGVSPTFKDKQIRKSNDSLQITAILRKPEGGFSWHREQDYLMNHLYLVKTRYPQVTVNLLCPPGELKDSPALQKIKAQKYFNVFSPKNDEAMCYQYSKADIFVSSSTYDAAGLPGLEAMRCGAALVTVYSGGNMDYCEHENNCLMSFRHENRLANDIGRLIQNRLLREKISSNGVREASKWSWQRSVSAFETALNNMSLNK